MSRTSRLAPWLVVIVALTVRLAYLYQYSGSPLFRVPMWDAGDYHDIALGLARGELDPALPFRPPLYPLLLSLLYMLFGAGALLPRLLQTALGVWSCLLVFRIGARLFGRGAGLGAGLAAALSGMMFYFDLELLPTSLLVFLTLLALEALQKVEDGGCPPLRAGVIGALAALARPVVLPFLALAALWVGVTAKRTGPAALYALGAALPLLFSLLLHLAAGWGPVVVSSQGGVNFFIGNHPESDGHTARFPGVGAGWGWDVVAGYAAQRAGKSLNPAQVDRFYYGEALHAVAADPIRWGRLLLRKAHLFFSRQEISSNRDLYYQAHRFPLFGWLLWLGFPLALPFAFAGFAFGRRRRGVQLAAGFIVVIFAVNTAFFTTARFRHPVTPLLFILAAGGVAGVVELLRGGFTADIKRWGGAVAAFLLGALLTATSSAGLNTGRWDYGLFTEGMALERLGRGDDAEEFYQRALKANPRAPYVNQKLAGLARDRGDWAAAVDLYRRELSIQPGYAKGWNELGVTLLLEGDEAGALGCFRRALRLQPALRAAAVNAAGVLRSRARAAASAGDYRLATGLLMEAVAILPGDTLLTAQLKEYRARSERTGP